MKKYKVLKNILNQQTIDIVKTSLCLIKDMNYHTNKKDVSDKNAFVDYPISSNCWHNYSAAFTEALLLMVQPHIEKEYGVELYPTYSYSRIYWPGASMIKHTDRPSCEYSVSVCLDVDPEPWGIWFDNEEVILYPGDMVVYKGMEVKHWREVYTGNQQIQTFLHYVDKNGPHAGEKFDRRELLGL